VITGLAREQIRDLILSVGTHQDVRALTPVEVATYFQTALDAGASREEIAEACLLEPTTAMIGRFLKLLDLAHDIQHLVVFGTRADSLSFTQAMEIARLSDLATQSALANAVLENGLSKDEVRAICQLLERSEHEVEEAVDQIVKLRLQIDRYFVLMGSIQETGAREFLKSKTQLERDEILVAALNELAFEGGGHLGVDRFTVSTRTEPSLGAAKLESEITALLVSKAG
jgi:hypothetical protein